ncbi:hypothetical protein [Streptomyces sp. NPDC047525]|uniref:hypothetical protein n=1 Tax=Streptomyces sp. NPDC047525 TaxID=3155264 RepID=UPI0033DA12D1
MPDASNRTGVCLVRIENQGDINLIKMRWNPDIEQASTERVRSCTDVETAVEAVRDFLTAFASGGGRRP